MALLLDRVERNCDTRIDVSKRGTRISFEGRKRKKKFVYRGKKKICVRRKEAPSVTVRPCLSPSNVPRHLQSASTSFSRTSFDSLQSIAMPAVFLSSLHLWCASRDRRVRSIRSLLHSSLRSRSVCWHEKRKSRWSVNALRYSVKKGERSIVRRSASSVFIRDEIVRQLG